jgi:L,D-peptidoglycan transpeptidase YkuD (ErfK/YbiS/YcfS/YnhG family)
MNLMSDRKSFWTTMAGILITLIFINFFITSVSATQSCSDQSYYNHSERSLQEWIDDSDWAAKVKIKDIDHKWIPYENCYLDDKTKCTQRDAGTFKSEIVNVIKGDKSEIKLDPAYCSKDLPDKIGMYVFYGSKSNGYDGYQFIAAENKNDKAALLNLEANIEQALIVHPDSQTIYQATITVWEKNGNEWRRVFDAIPAVIGRNGMASLNEKKEGDGRTPSGTYRLGTAFGYENAIDTKLSYRQVTAEDHWIDDPASAEYNQWVTGTPNAQSFENLKRDDDLYKYAVVIEYNTSPIKPGDGSAIFLHVWRAADKPTAGCVATDEANVKQLLSWLDPSRQPVIILNLL